MPYSLLAIHVFFLVVINFAGVTSPSQSCYWCRSKLWIFSLSNKFQMKYAEINMRNPNNYITKRTNPCIWLRRTVNKWLLFSWFIPLTKQNLKHTCETIKINGLHKYMFIKLVLWLCKLYLCKSNECSVHVAIEVLSNKPAIMVTKRSYFIIVRGITL